MKNHVVVMSPADVAAMRRATKDAEVAYFQAKVGALEFVAEAMSSTGDEYTASELAKMCGLTPNEIAAQLSYYGARASWQAGINTRKIDRRERVQELQYVRVMPNGQVDLDQSVIIRRRQKVYKIDSKHE